MGFCTETEDEGRSALPVGFCMEADVEDVEGTPEDGVGTDVPSVAFAEDDSPAEFFLLCLCFYDNSPKSVYNSLKGKH